MALAVICAALPATAGPAPSANEKVINAQQALAALTPDIQASAATFNAAITTDTAIDPAMILTTDAIDNDAAAHGVTAVTAANTAFAKEGGSALCAAELVGASSSALTGNTTFGLTSTGAMATDTIMTSANAFNSTDQHAVSAPLLVRTNGPNPASQIFTDAESENSQLLAASPNGAAPELVEMLC